MSFFVYPYKTGSASAKSIAAALHIPLLRREGSKFIGSPTKTIINWGAQDVTSAVAASRMLNLPIRLREASNKRTFFSNILEYNATALPEFQIPIPTVFFSYSDAYSYWQHMQSEGNGGTIVARTILNGHSGAGIHLLTTQQDWAAFQGTPCNLFTVYIKKLSEYRLHFTDFSSLTPTVAGAPKLFFVQRKALKTDALNQINSVSAHKVRNLANGYVYVNEGGELDVPFAVTNAASNYLKYNKSKSKLNFGALDIIYVKKYNKAYVLEVNTAPGLSGLTINKYAEQFENLKTQLEA